MNLFDGWTPRDDTVLLDGRPLSAYGLFVGSDGITVGEGTPRLTRTPIPGRNGVTDQTLRDPTGRAWEDSGRDITVHTVMACDEADARQLRRRLGALHGTRTSLWWQRMWEGAYQGTLAVGEWDDTVTPAGWAYATTTLTLHSDDGLQHAPTERIPLRNGTTRLTVLGNRISYPKITLTPRAGVTTTSVTIGATTLTWNVQTAFDGTRRITADSMTGISLYGSAPLPPTIDSDWPLLEPGPASITVRYASGRLEYEPLTLI